MKLNNGSHCKMAPEVAVYRVYQSNDPLINQHIDSSLRRWLFVGQCLIMQRNFQRFNLGFSDFVLQCTLYACTCFGGTKLYESDLP